MKRFILPIVMLISINSCAQIDTLNQFVISNSGESFESTSYILSFTIGEVTIGKFDINERIVSLGFHQPNRIENSIQKPGGFGNELKIYPNPTSNEIKLEFQLSQLEKVKISFFDMTGKQLETETHSVFSQVILFDMRDYSSGQYIIEVMSLDLLKKQTCKIIKQ